MISLNDHETEIVILALSKVLGSEQPHNRVDEYKKLLDRLKANQQTQYVHNATIFPFEIDEY
jgi:hypothetical protein